MVLAWKQPTFIGGADITGYFVDYREVVDGVEGKWHEANIKAISERAYRVSPKIDLVNFLTPLHGAWISIEDSKLSIGENVSVNRCGW